MENNAVTGTILRKKKISEHSKESTNAVLFLELVRKQFKILMAIKLATRQNNKCRRKQIKL
jgi:hypothetical protein